MALQQLGVSPQAALWLAALHPRRAAPVYSPGVYWHWHPGWHNVAVAFCPTLAAQFCAASMGLGRGIAELQQMQQMMQQWATAPLPQLLQPLLLYAAAPAAWGGDNFICCWSEALQFVYRFLNVPGVPLQPLVRRLPTAHPGPP
jgi:hypothetical protein